MRSSFVLLFRSLRIGVLAMALLGSTGVRADESGVPFWFSGSYASMAATPPTPGWTVTLMPYYYNGSAGSSDSFARGRTVVTGLDSHTWLLNATLGYAWETTLLGGVPSLSMTWGAGNSGNSASVHASLPAVNLQRTLSDSVNGGTDLYPTASLSWNKGNDNWMAYLTGDIPTGAYNPQRLSNLGLGHGAIDAGGGYTYLNQKTGFEASAVAGITGNFKNTDTDYRSGVDSHLDWAISQFLSANWELGVVGYVYYQLTNDSYPTDGIVGSLRQQVLGGFKSRVASVGPEVGYVFKMGKQTGYLNLRGYWEFWAQNRPEGYALFATINLPLGQ
jgi:hypothetical protein